MAGHDKMMMRGAMSDKEMDMMSDTDNQRQLQKMMSGLSGTVSDKEARMMSEATKMTPEEEIILDSLIKAGISMNTALDIMASNKVDSMNKLQLLRGETDQPVRPQEFGGLPKMMQPTAPQGQPMPMRTGGAMSQQDMMAYLASKTNTTKNAMGNMLSAMGGATPMMQPQMKTPMPTRGMTPTGMQQPMTPANPMMRR